MQGIRCEIDHDLEDVSASARSMVDWKHYVKTYPWVCLGSAAALGFSDRFQAIRGDPRHFGDRDWTGRDRPSGRKSVPAAARGVVDGLWLPSSALRSARQSPTWPKMRKGSWG